MRLLLGYPKDGWRPDLRDEVKKIQDMRVVDVRLTRRWIEIDVIVGGREEGERMLAELLGEPAWRRTIEVGEMPEEPIARALDYYGEDRVWEAYETLEELWRREEGEKKVVLHAILLGLAALVHRQRGRRNKGLEKRALEELKSISTDLWPVKGLIWRIEKQED